MDLVMGQLVHAHDGYYQQHALEASRDRPFVMDQAYPSYKHNLDIPRAVDRIVSRNEAG